LAKPFAEGRVKMKRAGLFAIAMGTLAGIGVSAAGQAYAGESDKLPKCSLATLKGQYVQLAGKNGTIFPPAFGVTKPAVSDAVGYSIFNGDGTGTTYVTFTVNGVVMIDRAVAPFTYTLASDCSGTWNGGKNQPQFIMYAAFDGSTIQQIATAPTGFANHLTGVRVGAPPEP
jgi:hypothetical protein